MPACDIIEEVPISDKMGGGASSGARENAGENAGGGGRGIVDAYRVVKDGKEEADGKEEEEEEAEDHGQPREDDHETSTAATPPSSSSNEAQHLRASLEEVLGWIERSEEGKREGNGWFGKAGYARASEHYTAALELLPLPDDVDIGGSSDDASLSLEDVAIKLRRQRCVLFANRAACRLQEGDYEGTVEDCSNALDLDDGYVKAYVRRAKAYEVLEEYDEGLADVKKVMELGGGGTGDRGWSEAYVRRVGPLAERRREELKDEMIGKLKELGNSFLGNFGLSLDNFKAEQGPDGGYSIKFG